MAIKTKSKSVVQAEDPALIKKQTVIVPIAGLNPSITGTRDTERRPTTRVSDLTSTTSFNTDKTLYVTNITQSTNNQFYDITNIGGGSGGSGTAGASGFSGFSGFSGLSPVIGGSTTQIQYNSAGLFAGSAGLTWNNSANLLNVIGTVGTGPIHETFATISPGTGSISVGSNTLFYYPSGMTSDFTLAISSLDLAVGSGTNVVLMLNQGGSAGVPNALTINGSSVTLKYPGGSSIAGTPNNVDVVSVSIFRTGSSTYLAFVQNTSFQ